MLKGHISEYDAALHAIKLCCAALEKSCDDLLTTISRAGTRTECDHLFNELQENQAVLANVFFANKVALSTKTELFVREFDRLDSVDLRDYWFKKLKSGYAF